MGAGVGHLRDGGTLDIPIPKAVHGEILTQGLGEEHRWVPDSGWTTFRMPNADDIEHARWLMRLSYRQSLGHGNFSFESM